MVRLDDEDKQRLDSVDELLAEPNWVSNWNRIHNSNATAGLNLPLDY